MSAHLQKKHIISHQHNACRKTSTLRSLFDLGKAKISSFLVILGIVALAGCAQVKFLSETGKSIFRNAPSALPFSQDEDTQNIHVAQMLHSMGLNTNKRILGNYKVGRPYVVAGKKYYPDIDYNYSVEGIASWYGPKFNLRQTANGAIFDMELLTAAHKTLPLPSIVSVTNLENGKTLRLLVNDRGPYVDGRIIDLSKKAASVLGMLAQGTARVRVRVLSAESRRLANYMKEQSAALSNAQALPVLASNEKATKLATQHANKGLAQAAPSISVTSEDLLPAVREDKEISERTTQLSPVQQDAADGIRRGDPTVAGYYAHILTSPKRDMVLSSTWRLTKSQPVFITRTESLTTSYSAYAGPWNSFVEADKFLEKLKRIGHQEGWILIVDK